MTHFSQIPAIAKSEWHPFTISSAPEDPNYFSVHVRGVGHWTNKLYQHFSVTKNNDKSVAMMVNPEKPLQVTL